MRLGVHRSHRTYFAFSKVCSYCVECSEIYPDCFAQTSKEAGPLSENIKYYSTHAEKLTNQYNSVEFEKVHRDWLSEIPDKGFVLDIGAGSGRDRSVIGA